METKRKIEIGMVYSAKIGASWLPVRMAKSLGHGRYQGLALPSEKAVRVSTDAIRGDGETMEAWRAKRTPKEHDLPVPPPTPKAQKARAAGKARPKADRRPSGLDAAAAVLAEAGKPMSTADMVNLMLGRGLWQTGGKTPAATIYAAIIREIAAKGEASRFRKAGPGMFELTAAGIAARTAAA